MDIVARVNPDVVVPAAGGLRFTEAEWQNRYGFPVPPDQFLEDVAVVAPRSERIGLEPGDYVERAGDNWMAHKQSSPYVRMVEDHRRYEIWCADPSVAAERFRDRNPLSSPPEEVRSAAVEYVRRDLLADLEHPANAHALAAWRRWQVRWRLDLHLPGEDDSVASWWVDFAEDPLSLGETGAGHTDIRTAVAASGIYDLLRGRCSTYGYLFTDRTRHINRVYVAAPDGLRRPATPVGEPMLTALAGPRDPDELYIDAQLEQWRPVAAAR